MVLGEILKLGVLRQLSQERVNHTYAILQTMFHLHKKIVLT
jgi:hypothetical protein